MRTDAEREECAVWKLEQGSYMVRRDGAGYVLTGPDGAEATLDDLDELMVFAEVVYDRVVDRMDDHAERVSKQSWKLVPRYVQKVSWRTFQR